MSGILWAEDSPHDQALIRAVLARMGAAPPTEFAGDGMKAIEKLASVRPDLVVLDLKMPLVGGLGVLTRIRQSRRFGRTPVVIFAGTRDPVVEERCRRAGIVAFLEKPTASEDFGEAVRRIVAMCPASVFANAN